MNDTMKRCPHDGGKCHHDCDIACLRENGGMYLTTPHKGYPLEGHVHPAVDTTPTPDRGDELREKVSKLIETPVDTSHRGSVVTFMSTAGGLFRDLLAQLDAADKECRLNHEAFGMQAAQIAGMQIQINKQQKQLDELIRQRDEERRTRERTKKHGPFWKRWFLRIIDGMEI